jgi:hypothetical protein
LESLASNSKWLYDAGEGCWRAYLKALRDLGFNLHAADPRTGTTFLMAFGRVFDGSLMKALIKVEPDMKLDAVDFCGRSVLHTTKVVLPKLLARCDLNATDQWGVSALAALMSQLLTGSGKPQLDGLRVLWRHILGLNNEGVIQLACDCFQQLFEAMHPFEYDFHERWLYLAIQLNDVDAIEAWARCKGTFPINVATIHAAFEQAGGNGDLEPLKKILQSGGDLTVIDDDTGMNGLWVRPSLLSSCDAEDSFRS